MREEGETLLTYSATITLNATPPTNTQTHTHTNPSPPRQTDTQTQSPTPTEEKENCIDLFNEVLMIAKMLAPSISQSFIDLSFP